jgi:hypothetical protein
MTQGWEKAGVWETAAHCAAVFPLPKGVFTMSDPRPPIENPQLYRLQMALESDISAVVVANVSVPIQQIREAWTPQLTEAIREYLRERIEILQSGQQPAATPAAAVATPRQPAAPPPRAATPAGTRPPIRPPGARQPRR